MPVHQPVFDPPFNVVRSSHVELGVRDLARSRAFYVDCLGLLVSDETDDALLDAAQIKRIVGFIADQEAEAIDIKGARAH